MWFYRLAFVALIILSAVAALYHGVAWTVFGCFSAWIAKSEVVIPSIMGT